MSDLSVLHPSYWRQRAAEARQAAKDIVNPANRKILDEVVRSYEDMADLMEPTWRIIRQNQSVTAPRPPAKADKTDPRPPRTCSSTQR
jgi:hypothetical protein